MKLLDLLAEHAELLRLGGLFTATALLLLLALPKERRHLFKMGVLFALSLVLRAASAGAAVAIPSAVQTLHFLALLLQGIAFIGVVAVIFFGLLLPRLRLEAPRIARDLAVALAYLVLVFYLLSAHRVDVTGVIATSAVVTAVIGFSLQETLANVMGGVGLQLDGALRPGDWVKLEGQSGMVREISWRHTAIETRNGDTLLVPNSVLMKTAIVRQGQKVQGGIVQERRWIHFGVDYRYPPTQVIDVVTEALTREPIPNVASNPAPNVIVMEFAASWVGYAARYWLTDLYLDDPTDSVVRTRVFFALRRAASRWRIPPPRSSSSSRTRRGGSATKRARRRSAWPSWRACRSSSRSRTRSASGWPTPSCWPRSPPTSRSSSRASRSTTSTSSPRGAPRYAWPSRERRPAS